MRFPQNLLGRKSAQQQKDPQFLLILDFTDINDEFPRTNFGAHITPCTVNIDDTTHSFAGKNNKYRFKKLEKFLQQFKEADEKTRNRYLSDTDTLPPVIRDVILPQLNEFQQSLKEGQYAKLVIVTGGHGNGGISNIFSLNEQHYCSAKNIAHLCAAVMLISEHKGIPFKQKSLIAESCYNLSNETKSITNDALENGKIRASRMESSKALRDKHTVKHQLQISALKNSNSFAKRLAYKACELLGFRQGFTQITGSEYANYRSTDQLKTYKAQSGDYRKKIAIESPPQEEFKEKLEEAKEQKTESTKSLAGRFCAILIQAIGALHVGFINIRERFKKSGTSNEDELSFRERQVSRKSSGSSIDR